MQKELSDVQFSGVILPFIHTMPEAYAVADLMVCRAGAMTLSELLVLGMPALLGPFPHATANHQMKNAMDLKNKGAVEVIADDEIKTERFTRTLLGLIKDDARRKLLSENASKLGNMRGAEAITEEILKLI